MWAKRRKALAGGRQGYGERQLPLALRGTARHAAAAAAAKGARGACDACLYACVAWPRRQQVEPGPALTLSNAVPWVRSEKDTSLSSQFLVVRRRRGGFNWANEISRDEVPRARCGRSAERRLRKAGGGAAGGGYFWPCARYSCGAHARGFRKRSILRLWFMTEGCVWPRRKPVGVGTADRRQQVAPGPARQAQPACPAALVRVKLKTLPLPGSLCTRMVSPMAWRISLAMDRPRPEPELPCDLSTL